MDTISPKGHIILKREKTGEVIFEDKNAISPEFLHNLLLCLFNPSVSNIPIFSDNFFSVSNESVGLTSENPWGQDGIIFYATENGNWRTISCSLDTSFPLANSAIKLDGSILAPSGGLSITGLEMGSYFSSFKFNYKIAEYDSATAFAVLSENETYNISWIINL